MFEESVSSRRFCCMLAVCLQRGTEYVDVADGRRSAGCGLCRAEEADLYKLAAGVGSGRDLMEMWRKEDRGKTNCVAVQAVQKSVTTVVVMIMI